MDLGNAKAIVQNMKAKYAAFERLEQAIAAVEQAHGLQAEREQALVTIMSVIEEKKAELSELTNKVNLQKDALAATQLSYAKKTHELEEGYKALRQTIANGSKEAERQAELAKSALLDELQAMHQEKATLERSIDALRTQIAAIRQSLNIPNT